MKRRAVAFLAGLFGLAAGWMLHPAPDLAGALDKQQSATAKGSPSRGDSRSTSASPNGSAARLIIGQFAGGSRADLFHAGLEVFSSNEKQRRELAAAGTLGSVSRKANIANITGVWFRDDPAAALAYMGTIEGKEREAAAREVMSGWSRRDPEAAATWALQQGDQLDDDTFRVLLRGWLEQDAPKAMDWAVSSLTGSLRQQTSQGTFESWMNSDPKQALAWFEELDDAANPTGAASALDSGTFGEANPDYFEQVAAGWAGKHSQAAAYWAQTIPDESARGAACAQVAEHWARADPEASAAWLSALPEGNARDAAVQRCSEQLHSIDPAASLRWVETMSNQSARWETTSELAGQWPERDPEAAAAWIENHPTLTANQRRTLLESRN